MSLILRKPKGATHKKKRLGIGNASGHGGTATRGHKGAQSRSGYSRKIGFEGGQMPLLRRIPKRGFNNGRFKKIYQEIHLSDLNKFDDGATISINDFIEKKIIKNENFPIKILNNGKLEKKVALNLRSIKKGRKTFNFDKVTKSSEKIITDLGGSIKYE